jgi:hypothetical protein
LILRQAHSIKEKGQRPVGSNEADETDPSWTPYTEKCVDNASPAMSLNFKENNDKNVYYI